MSTNTKIPSYNPKYNSFNNEILSFIFKEDAIGTVFENKPHFYGLIQYKGHKVLVLGCTELMTWIATVLARNNAVTYITHEKELYEKFIKTVNDFKFGGDDVGILCKDEKDYINKLSELKDMKFDKVIMNPPYGKLATKILTKVYEFCNSIISLQPTSEMLDKKYKKRKKIAEVYTHVQTYTKINNPFDASIAAELSILKLEHDKPVNLNIQFSDLYQIELEIFNKICRYEKTVSDVLTTVYNQPVEVDDNKLIIPLIRGHKTECGEYKWDWTTLYSNNPKSSIHICRETHYIEGYDLTKLKQFLNSDILGYALLLVKNSSNMFFELDYVPFDESLDEAVLIKKLGLTDEELAYIKDKMKNFGYKAKKR